MNIAARVLGWVVVIDAREQKDGASLDPDEGLRVVSLDSVRAALVMRMKAVRGIGARERSGASLGWPRCASIATRPGPGEASR